MAAMRGGVDQLDNPNPTVRQVDRDAKVVDSLAGRVFDIIRDIRDPEHDHSLEALSVVDSSCVSVSDPPDDSPGYGRVRVIFTPTVPHCSMAAVIGLSIMSKLRISQLLAKGHGEHYYKLDVRCKEDAHTTADAINKQLADKERVAAAFENPSIISLLDSCINNLP